MSKYKFKGYTITCCGYHQPDHCVRWEAVDDSGCACFYGNTLREVEFMIIDSEWEDKLKAKDSEVAELRECLKEAIDVTCDGCHFAVWENGKIVKCKKHKNWKCPFHKNLKCPFGTERWRKALEGENDEGK